MASTCGNCQKPDADRPSIFRGMPWCSDRCRKAMEAEAMLTDIPWEWQTP